MDAPLVLRDLVEASKGPTCSPFDPREPYRDSLVRAAFKLQASFNTDFDKLYRGLNGESSDWLRTLEDSFGDDIEKDSFFVQTGFPPCRLRGEGLRFRVELPQWLTNHDLLQVYHDLEKVGCVGAFESRDGVYEMLHLADGQQQGAVINEDDCFLARWFAAWLRGLCQGRQAEVAFTMKAVLAPGPGQEQNFMPRTEAKSFIRTCEEVADTFVVLLDHFRQDRSCRDKSCIDRIFRQAAAFVANINGCIYVAETGTNLHAAVLAIQNAAEAGKFKIMRMKNGFVNHAATEAGYRELTIWLELAEHLLVEVQLHLKVFFDGWHFLQLPVDFCKCLLDWPHLAFLIRSLQQQQEAEGNDARRQQEQARIQSEEEERRRAEEEEHAERHRMDEQRERYRLRVEQIKKQKARGFSVASLVEEGFSLQEFSMVASAMKSQDACSRADLTKLT